MTTQEQQAVELLATIQKLEKKHAAELKSIINTINVHAQALHNTTDGIRAILRMGNHASMQSVCSDRTQVIWGLENGLEILAQHGYNHSVILWNYVEELESRGTV
ncbi:MAG: hypothetical protein R8L53_04955 [Mariprofundales bacterium]